jgi:hypothetical protein
LYCLLVYAVFVFFVIFLSGSKSVCFLYNHSLTLLLYCLHVYAVIVFLWSFWVAVNLYVFYTTIHWPCYCTVYMFMLSLFFLWSFWVGVNLYVFIQPFTDPVIVLSTCLCCHCFFVVFLSGSKPTKKNHKKNNDSINM